MSLKQIDLPYVIDNGDQPGDARLANISNPQSSKKWIMHSPQNFYIFTLKFKNPSYVYFVEMKGLNTYKLDLSFKDNNRKFICEKSFIFESQDQLKLVQIWQHPFSTYVQVKLLNNRYTPLRMGLNYIIFKGKTDPNFQPLDIEAIINPKQPKKAQIFKDRQTKKPKIGIVLQLENGNPKNNDLYFGDEQQNKKRNQFNPTMLINKPLQGPTQMITDNPHQVILDLETVTQNQQIQSVFPLTHQEIQAQIIENNPLKKPYVTYAYDQTREWWNILKFVRKQWVQGQRNIENQKNIAVEDRMSNKIQVKHLFRKKVMAQGLDLQRKNIIEQSALLMGATIVAEPQPGCLVVTTREYGEKIRRMKKFKVSKVVTEEYIFNCKMFNALLNQQDYVIR